MSELIEHPAARRMRRAKVMKDAVTTPEAQELRIAICSAMNAYFDYLDDKGVIGENGAALIAKRDMDAEDDFEVILEHRCRCHEHV